MDEGVDEKDAERPHEFVAFPQLGYQCLLSVRIHTRMVG
jgi:hypothetical protein